ncbi:hypothetical protein CRUP_027243 [Coryphaenoides rupestris]|nr:hypothetical protein CRUP_027243 [Coryphaenoides rupestris]
MLQARAGGGGGRGAGGGGGGRGGGGFVYKVELFKEITSNSVCHPVRQPLSSPPMSALRVSGSSPGHQIWILLAVAHLAVDFSICSPLSPAMGLKPQHKAVPGSRPRWQPLWDAPNMLHWRTVSPLARRLLSPVSAPRDGRAGLGSKVRVQRHRKPARRLDQALCKDCDWKYSQAGDSPAPLAEAAAAGGPPLPRGGKGDRVRLLRRARRQLKWDSYDKSQEGRTTTVAGFIDWGPTGTEDNIEEDGKPVPNIILSTKALGITPTASTTTTSTTKVPIRTIPVATTPQSTTGMVIVETVKPPKPGDPPEVK